MGTRADFYVGRNPETMEWLGSIAWDGYPDGIESALLRANHEPAYRAEVEAFLSKRKDATRPEQGWPWPWDNSHTTDFSYTYDEEKVWASCFGHAWHDPTAPTADDHNLVGPKVPFPDMRDRKNVTMGERSGVIMLTAPKRSTS